MAENIDRNLALELVRVTEAAALMAGRWMGRGDKIAADQAAVDAMRSVLDTIQMEGHVVIGEGSKDEAPMLYIGELVGCADYPKVDIAVDPIDGTRLVANGMPNALVVLAVAERGTMLALLGPLEAYLNADRPVGRSSVSARLPANQYPDGTHVGNAIFGGL